MENKKTTIEVDKQTARRVQITKQNLGYKTAAETINKIFDIAEKISEASK